MKILVIFGILTLENKQCGGNCLIPFSRIAVALESFLDVLV